MKYRVSGANRSTGQAEARTIDATTEHEARQAAGRSMLVESVEATELPTARLACSNCDAPIGKLERPHEWKGAAVCAACYARLGGGSGFLDTKRNAKAANTLVRVFVWIVAGFMVLFIIGLLANR